MREVRKGMRLFGSVMLLLCVIFALAACGKEKRETRDVNSVIVEAKQETEAQSEGEFYGTIKQYFGGILTVETENGTEFELDVTSTRLECKNGIVSGEEVTINYTGIMTGSDISKAVITRITDREDRPEPKQQSISGEIVSCTANTLVVEDAEGNAYTFVTVGADMHFEQGIQVKNWAKVVFKGEISTENEKNVVILSVLSSEHDGESGDEDLGLPDEEENPAAETADAYDEKIHQIDGLLAGMKDYRIEVYSERTAQQSVFDISATDIYLPNGFAIGQPISVTYMGDRIEDSNSAICLSVRGNAIDSGGAALEGRIIATSANCLTLLTSDGAEVTFDIEDAEVKCAEGPRIGSSVQVTYGITPGSNIHKALTVEDVQ